MDWYCHILDRYLEAGYSTSALVSVFRGIPYELANVLKESIQALHILRTSQLARMTAPPPLLECFDTAPTIAYSDHFDYDIDSSEAQDDCGYLCFEWYPETQVTVSKY